MEMNKMNKLLAVAAAAEAATGLILMIDPPIVTRLLLGAEISGVAIVLGRLCGIGLLSFGLACWPGRNAAATSPGVSGDADLQRSLYSLTSCISASAANGRTSLVAGSCVARRCDLPPRLDMV